MEGKTKTPRTIAAASSTDNAILAGMGHITPNMNMSAKPNRAFFKSWPLGQA